MIDVDGPSEIGLQIYSQNIILKLTSKTNNKIQFHESPNNTILTEATLRVGESFQYHPNSPSPE